MVVNKSITNLMDIGFSEYEARSYIALIGTNPATAYENARISGIPTSKIYEVISRLSEKGVVSVIETHGKKRYIPLSSDEFIESRRSKLENTLNDLKHELSNLSTKTDVSFIWNVHDYDYLMRKAERMIEGANNTILISAWAEEVSHLENILKRRERKSIDIVIVHFGDVKIKTGQIFQHPIEETIYAEKGGRGFVVVVDSNEALMGTVFNNSVEGAWSMNKGFVTLAEDYIKHDVYIMKIVRRFERTLLKRFGKNYAKLRNIFNDEEEK